MGAFVVRAGVILLIGIAGILPGCSKKEDAPTVHRIEGVIQSIDAATSTITVRFTPPRSKREVSRSGTVSPDSEIQINGVVSALTDLRVGERVTITGYTKGDGNDQQLIAQKIEATRAKTIRKAPVTQPKSEAPRDGDTTKGAEQSAGTAPPASP